MRAIRRHLDPGRLCRVLLPLVYLSGCETTPDSTVQPAYDAFVAACGRPPEEAVDGKVLALSRECSSALGDRFAVDWDSFEESPHEIPVAATTAELVIGGFYSAAGPGNSTRAAILAPGCPSELGAILMGLADDASLSSDNEGGELWFLFLDQGVSSTRRDASLASLMRYDDGAVLIGDLAQEDDENPWTVGWSAPSVASGLVHEAAHGSVLEYHVPCEESAAELECDADPEGAYGVQAWWLYIWLTTNGTAADLGVCVEMVELLDDVCDRILDHREFVPCQPLDDALGACEAD